MAIEGSSSQPMLSPKTTSASTYETLGSSPSTSSMYQRLHYSCREFPMSIDQRPAHAGMCTLPQQQQQQQHRQHCSGNVIVCHPQTSPISIPTTAVIPAQQVMIHSPTALHCPSTGMCPNCSLGFQQASSPSAARFLRRSSSEEASYCNIHDSGKKKYQNVAGPPSQ